MLRNRLEPYPRQVSAFTALLAAHPELDGKLAELVEKRAPVHVTADLLSVLPPGLYPRSAMALLDLSVDSAAAQEAGLKHLAAAVKRDPSIESAIAVKLEQWMPSQVMLTKSRKQWSDGHLKPFLLATFAASLPSSREMILQVLAKHPLPSVKTAAKARLAQKTRL